MKKKCCPSISMVHEVPDICHWPTNLSCEQRKRVIQCAKWSQAAYLDEQVDHASEPRTDMTDMTYVTCEGCDAQGIIFNASDGALVIAVRGTTSAMDMLCDVQVLQTLLEDIPDVFVHDGFNDQFKALSGVTNARIIAHLQTGGELVCTGHSLGAGVAALLAVSYAIRFPGKVSYFGYGSPRPGNAVFSQHMVSHTSLAIIVKNKRDPVCASIPAVCYTHAGALMLIGADPFPDLPNILHIQDHDIARYVKNLKEKLPDEASTTKSKNQRQCSIV